LYFSQIQRVDYSIEKKRPLVVIKMKADILLLKDELESLNAFLKKMSEVEDPDEQSKCWMKEV